MIPEPPDPWGFALLTLAAYRIWYLVAEDKILTRPREWILRRIAADEWIECPWCSGFWICGALTGGWFAATGTTNALLFLAVWWGMSAVVGLIERYAP